MTTKSAFSVVGLAHKVCLSAEEQGYTPELLNSLAENSDLFRQLLQVQRGYAEMKLIKHVIDCDANPFVPDGWKVEEHQKGGQLVWDASKVQLYLSDGQKNGKVIEGNKLRKELAGKPVLNANVLDHLLANPHLIPEEWKGKVIFFWGTIYCSSDGRLYVRCLYCFGDRWDLSCNWLGFGWHDDDPVALRAS